MGHSLVQKNGPLFWAIVDTTAKKKSTPISLYYFPAVLGDVVSITPSMTRSAACSCLRYFNNRDRHID